MEGKIREEYSQIALYDFLKEKESETNSLRFKKKYKGKIIRANGIVSLIEESGDGGCLRLDYTEDVGYAEDDHDYCDRSIFCNFDNSQISLLLELNAGDKIVVEGTYWGREYGRVMELHNCRIVK